MNIVQVYRTFPTQQNCIDYLEKVRWNNKPTCPYCKSENQTPLPKENRYHCNTCNTSFSVMVGTIFENTKLDFQKWFLAISLVLNAKKGISARQLARDIEVTKDTAWLMLMRIRTAMTENCDLLEGIIEADETYVGGKNKNRHTNKKTKDGQDRGGEDKTPVIGILERGSKVSAQKAKDTSGETLKSFINMNVKSGSQIMTDEWRSYNGLALLYGHSIVKHSMGENVNGAVHINTLEGFWSLLKRGVIGLYHYVSSKYLNKYIDEFCFRYNNRENVNIFDLTIFKTVNL
ncbi:MAG: IS1595 family transposase [Prolixibacteraceae bacterium]|jgi:transposase-like protein|nr:IS1595 family transposase [Prolixibacteraceae bacterium]